MKSGSIVKIPVKQVEVELTGDQSTKPLDADGIALAAQKLGMANISPGCVSQLGRLGGMLHGPGVIHLATGGVFVSQQVLLETLKDIKSAMDSADDEAKPEFAPKIGYLADKLARVSQTMLKMSDTVRSASEPEAEKPKRRSFEPCTIVQNNYYGKDSTQTPKLPEPQ